MRVRARYYKVFDLYMCVCPYRINRKFLPMSKNYRSLDTRLNCDIKKRQHSNVECCLSPF